MRLINDPLKKLLLQRLPLEWASFHPSHWLLRHRIAGDSAFQSWEWDTRMGGTMPTIYQVFLYKSKHGWKAIDPAPEPSELVLQDLLVDTIYRSLVKDDSTIILVERWKGDNLHSGLEVGLARVQGDTLCLTLPIVRGDTVTRLSFAFSEADNFVRLRTTFDERRQILYVPDSRQLPNFILYRRYQYSRRQLVPMKDTVIVSTDTFDDLVRYHRYLRERRRHYDSLTRQSN